MCDQHIKGAMKKLCAAAEWMWNHRGNNIWWRPNVLTLSNPDSTNPRLTLVEATSTFRLLEEEKLIFPVQNPNDMNIAYLINEVKEEEWVRFLKGLNPWDKFLFRPLLLLFKTAWTVLIWFMSVVVAVAIGGFFGAWMESQIK